MSGLLHLVRARQWLSSPRERGRAAPPTGRRRGPSRGLAGGDGHAARCSSRYPEVRGVSVAAKPLSSVMTPLPSIVRRIVAMFEAVASPSSDFDCTAAVTM